MVRILVLCALLVVLASPAYALTASWQKNTEPDMQDYGVYMCFARGCVVAKTPAMLQAYVLHSATVAPSFSIPLAIEGAVAITARDVKGNESGLSVSVPFDQVAPQVPASLIVQ